VSSKGSPKIAPFDDGQLLVRAGLCAVNDCGGGSRSDQRVQKCKWALAAWRTSSRLTHSNKLAPHCSVSQPNECPRPTSAEPREVRQSLAFFGPQLYLQLAALDRPKPFSTNELQCWKCRGYKRKASAACGVARRSEDRDQNCAFAWQPAAI
jgi:hypothetical protein